MDTDPEICRVTGGHQWTSAESEDIQIDPTALARLFARCLEMPGTSGPTQGTVLWKCWRCGAEVLHDASRPSPNLRVP